MASYSITDYDVLTKGLNSIAINVKSAAPSFTAIRDVMFGQPSFATSDDFVQLNTVDVQVALPSDAVKGTDPTRVNYRTGFNAQHLFPGYYFLEDKVDLSGADNRVAPEEPIGAPWSVQQRLLYLLDQKRAGMVASFDLAEEKLCADAILTGSYTTKNGGTQTLPVKTGLLALDGSALITNPMGTLAEAVNTIVSEGVAVPTQLWMNYADMLQLASSDTWLALLDNRRVVDNLIGYQPINSNGLAYCGTISVLGAGQLAIYSYMGSYINEEGTRTSFIPQGSAILAPASVGRMAHCGLLYDAGGVQGVQAADRYFTVYPKTRGALVDTMVQGQTAPAPVITAFDGYGVITGIPSV